MRSSLGYLCRHEAGLLKNRDYLSRRRGWPSDSLATFPLTAVAIWLRFWVMGH